MTARPILFSGPMVRALLDGRKAQTRRIIKPQPEVDGGDDSGGPAWWLEWGKEDRGYTPDELARLCPYGKPGHLLWVRETWQLHTKATDLGKVVYRASEAASHTEFHQLVPVSLVGNMPPKPFQEGWRSPLHMPRWASRLTLELTDVRVQRLQDISEADAAAEGFASDGDESARIWYAGLWDRINGTGAWDANPWVWALTFKVHQQNVDQVIAGERMKPKQSLKIWEVILCMIFGFLVVVVLVMSVRLMVLRWDDCRRIHPVSYCLMDF